MNTPTQKMKTLPVALAAVMALILTTACGDRPIVDVSQEQDGRPMLRALTGVGNFLRPEGDVDLTVAIDNFDFNVPDGFDRSSTIHAAANCGEPCPAYGLFFDDLKDASETDQRGSVPTVADVVHTGYAGGNYLLVTAPNTNAVPDIWNWFGSFDADSLEEGDEVWIGLARYGVNVTGRLDQEEILTGRAVQQDALVLVGGSPGGDGSRRADQFNDGRDGRPGPFPAEPNANPFVIGHSVVGDVQGDLVADFVISSFDDNGSEVYMLTGEEFDATRTPFVPNDLDTPLDGNEYNYIVFWGSNPLTNPNAEVLFRIQIGADLQAGALSVANNAFAPFPQTTVDITTVNDLPGGANAEVVPGQIGLDGVGFMAGPTFEIGVYNRGDGSFTPVESRVVITDTLIVDPINGIIDTLSVDTLRGVSTFNSPRGGAAVEITMDALESGVSFGDNTHVVARLQGVQGSEFLYQEYETEDGTFQEGGTSFGAFNSGGASSTVYTLEGQGAMRFFGDSLLLDLSRITPTPPAGFHYQSYLIGFTESGTNLQRLHAIELDARGNGQDRIGVDEIEGEFANYNFWVLAIEPDGGQLTADGVQTLQTQVSEDYRSKFSDFFPR